MTDAVVVNARFQVEGLSGVERYAMEVTRRLGDRVRLVHPMRNGTGLLGHLWEQIALPNWLEDLDLLWSPANTGPLGVKNQVVTIHDISPIDFPNWFERRFSAWYAYLLPRLASWVKKVITDSEFSRRRIIEVLKIPEDRVVTIPWGVDRGIFFPKSEAEIEKVRQRYNLPAAFILAVGSLEPRRNLERLIQAWRQVNQRFRDVELVVVGGNIGPFRKVRLGYLESGVHLKGRVEAADMPALYSSASALVMPSLYEGFGLPTLEAMACGTPVIASQVTALPELVGDAGILVDPYNVGEISEAIQEVISDDGLRKTLAVRGEERVNAYTWERTVEMVWDVLQEAREQG